MIDAKVLTIGFDAISKKMSENRISLTFRAAMISLGKYLQKAPLLTI